MPGFDLIASTYDRLARLVYGQAIVKAQRAFLGEIPVGSRVLVIGGGTGWVLGEIMAHAHPAHICYVDASAKMIELAQTFSLQHIPPNTTGIDFLHGTEQSLGEFPPFDVIITFFFLDMFESKRLGEVMVGLKEKLKVEGKWLFADFQVPRNAFRPIASAMIWGMYRFFRLIANIEAKRLPDFEGGFKRIGLVKQAEKHFFQGMITTKIYQEH